jgi:hypothetical protein
MDDDSILSDALFDAVGAVALFVLLLAGLALPHVL